jgi:hypothetical protein
MIKRCFRNTQKKYVANQDSIAKIKDKRHYQYDNWSNANQDYAALVNTLICLIARIQAGQSQPNFAAAASLSSSVKTTPAS